MHTALVLFSGGQDSTVCLAWALEKYERVETVGFNYGQNHSVEMQCRAKVLQDFRAAFPQWAARLGDDTLIDLSGYAAISESALTRDIEIRMQEDGLPNTFVPGRNLLFFTLAAALGYRRGITDLIGGMCETDFSGYPDCRKDTLESLNTTLNLGMDRKFSIVTPLMHIDKAGTWKLAKELGGDALVNIMIEDTHTCYKGDRLHRHDWGYGCAECPACVLRAKGYEKYIGAIA